MGYFQGRKPNRSRGCIDKSELSFRVQTSEFSQGKQKSSVKDQKSLDPGF